MRPNVEALQGLINERFGNNKAAFAATLNVNRSQVSLILNKDGQGAGAIFMGALIAFCENEGLDFHDYLFLPTNVKKLTPEKREASA